MYFFVSDVHLKSGGKQSDKSCEKRFLEWLDSVGSTAREVYLLGDIFDFWYEYKHVVPKGFVRVLAKFAELTDRGVRVVFIAGNHDMWVRDYFSRECGVEIYTTPQKIEIAGRKIYLAHGDNLNVGKSWGLRLMNTLFRSPIIRALFSTFIHPDLALAFGHWWSNSSRKKHDPNNQSKRDREQSARYGVDILTEYVTSHHTELRCDYYIFGHMHTLADKEYDGARIMLMNDWSQNPHYIEINAEGEAAIKEV